MQPKRKLLFLQNSIGVKSDLWDATSRQKTCGIVDLAQRFLSRRLITLQNLVTVGQTV